MYRASLLLTLSCTRTIVIHERVPNLFQQIMSRRVLTIHDTVIRSCYSFDLPPPAEPIEERDAVGENRWTKFHQLHPIVFCDGLNEDDCSRERDHTWAEYGRSAFWYVDYARTSCIEEGDPQP